MRINDHSSHSRRLHCRELDGERTGIIEFYEGRVELYYVGYDEFLHIPDDSPSYVLTEEGEVVSLYANIAGRSSSKGIVTKRGGDEIGPDGDEFRRVSQAGICSNVAVIGVDAWRPEDHVRLLTFEVSHPSHGVFSSASKLRSIGQASEVSEADLALYRVESGDLILTAGLKLTYSLETDAPKTCQPIFSIEFSMGRPLIEIEKGLALYLDFFSFLSGQKITPKAVHVDRMSSADRRRAIDEGRYVRDHNVFWDWRVEEGDPRHVGAGGFPFLTMREAELRTFAASLKAWVERADTWSAAYAQMTESFSLQGYISAERLIVAWRWFEEVPTANPRRSLDDSIVDELIEAAIERARDRSLGNHIEDRIRGSLRRISEESMRDRFERLMGSIRRQFGCPSPLSDMISHLNNARRFRGRVAHGHFVCEEKSELRQFHKATLALETLCFLLTACDLPLTEEAKEQIWHHPVPRAYALAVD